MPVKVAEGQLLQAVKQLFPQDIAPPLGQLGHEGGLGIGTDGRNGIDPQQLQNGGQKAGQVGLAVFRRLGNGVDNGPHEVGSCH